MSHNSTDNRMPMDFMVGIECTMIVDVRTDLNPDMRELDQYELMKHYTRWREDLDLVAKLRTEHHSVKRIRWALPWYRVETAPGVYDWSWTDQVVDYALELGIELVVDVVHYGCPRWMPLAFLDPTYPERVASFAAAAAERYKGKINDWTPFNEPAVAAEFGAKSAQWPPYENNEQAFVRSIVAIAEGMQLSTKRIRAIDPAVRIWAAESVKNYHPVNAEAAPFAKAALRKDLVIWDLVHGKVDEKHEYYGWLTGNGATPEQLPRLRANAVVMDVLGINFYPWLSQTYEWKDGGIQQFWDWNGNLLLELLQGCYEHTGARLCVTETSAHGGGGPKSQSMIDGAGDFRQRWLDETVAAVAEARSQGIPCLGYTQYPLYTMIDWKYRLETGCPEDFFVHFGMIEVDEKDYSRRWTPVADRFLHHMRTFECEGAGQQDAD